MTGEIQLLQAITSSSPTYLTSLLKHAEVVMSHY